MEPGLYIVLSIIISIKSKECKASFLQYLQLFELVETLRDEYDRSPLITPLLILPVNRSAQGFQSNVELTGFDYSLVKRQNDWVNSKSHTSIIPLAIGKSAEKYRLLLERDKGTPFSTFRSC